MEFCKAYNAATESQRGNVVPVEITVYEDRSFTFALKTPPAAKLLLKAARCREGLAASRTAPRSRSVTMGPGPRDRRDQDARPQRQRHRRSAAKIIAGTARSMGITVTELTRSDVGTRTRGRAGAARNTTTPTERTNESAMKRSKGYRRQPPRRSTARSCTRPLQAVNLAKETGSSKIGRHRRGRDAARRRPAQGRPDGPRHRQPAARHRQDRPGRWCSPPATRPPRPRPPARTSSAATT